jgi:hypothetical protein
MDERKLKELYELTCNRIVAEANTLRNNIIRGEHPIKDIGRIRNYQSEFNRAVKVELSMLFDALTEYKEQNNG